MSTDINDPPGKTAASLLSDILGDLQRLVEQQFQLTRHEIEEEVQERSGAGLLILIGIGLLFLSAFELCLTTTHWLHWATTPVGTELARLPLWGCHALVAAALLLVGGVVTWIGRVRFNAINATENPVTELSKERAIWKIHLK